MNAYAAERVLDVDISIDVVDHTAASGAQVSGSAESELSQIGQVLNGKTGQSKKIGTPEPRQFLLDGTFEIMPDSYGNLETGFRSRNISGGLGYTRQTLSVRLTGMHSTYGFTLFFDDKAEEYAEEVEIKAYAGGTEVAHAKFFGNSEPVMPCALDVENFDKVDFIFTKTSNSYRKVRVTEIVFGIIEKFDKNNLSEVRVLRELAPIMQSFPSCELEITIDDADRKYDVMNPHGIYKYLNKTHGLSVKLGAGTRGNVEYAPLGKYYFTEAVNIPGQRAAKIIARDMAGLLDDYTALASTGTQAITLQRAIETELALSSFPFEISPIFLMGVGSLLINSGHEEMTCREFFRKAAQAARCVCYFGKDGRLTFTRLASGGGANSVITGDVLYRPLETIAEREYTTCIVKNSSGEIGRYTTGAEGQVLEIENSLILPSQGDLVARWALQWQRKAICKAGTRGDPSADIGAQISIDAYAQRVAHLTREEFIYNGGLQAEIMAAVEV